MVRHAVLEAAGIPHEIAPAQVDERLIEHRSAAADAGELAAVLAREKAIVVAAARPGALVLGADQTLVLGSRMFSKPRSRAAARKQLALLRDRTHQLHSAIAIVRDGAVVLEHRETAQLTMRNFSDDFLETYLDLVGNSATASVGAYQLEKLGIQLFERIEGDHFVILGLPLLALLRFLRRERLLLS
jgi:septum formation protein